LQDKFDQPAITVSEVEGKPVVIAIEKKLLAEIPLGSVITSVDGEDTFKYAQENVMPYLPASTDHARLDDAFRGKPYQNAGIFWRENGSKIKVTYETPSGKAGETELVCDLRGREVEWAGAVQSSSLLEWRWLEDGIAYVVLNSFNQPKIVEDFKAIVPELRNAKGIILDIRNNGGGSTNIGTDILDHFTTKELQGGKWKTREHRSAFYAWAKNDPEDDFYKTYGSLNAWFEGGAMTLEPTDCEKLSVPVVVLIDYKTFSAAEDFLIFCDQLEQFTLVGRPSGGSTGQPIFMNLPNGGWAAICAKRDTYPDGREFVGYGVQPDVYAGPTIKAIAEGRDAVLEKGVEVLKGKIAEGK
jgi:carboxyl-terminal processing protease